MQRHENRAGSLFAAVALACALGGSASHAEEDATGPAPQIGLDRLLRLPVSLDL